MFRFACAVAVCFGVVGCGPSIEIVTRQIPPDVICPAGGARIQIYEDGSVVSESVICNGEDGADGKAGDAGVNGTNGQDAPPPPEECKHGSHGCH